MNCREDEGRSPPRTVREAGIARQAPFKAPESAYAAYCILYSTLPPPSYSLSLPRGFLDHRACNSNPPFSYTTPLQDKNGAAYTNARHLQANIAKGDYCSRYLHTRGCRDCARTPPGPCKHSPGTNRQFSHCDTSEWLRKETGRPRRGGLCAKKTLFTGHRQSRRGRGGDRRGWEEEITKGSRYRRYWRRWPRHLQREHDVGHRRGGCRRQGVQGEPLPSAFSPHWSQHAPSTEIARRPRRPDRPICCKRWAARSRRPQRTRTSPPRSTRTSPSSSRPTTTPSSARSRPRAARSRTARSSTSSARS